MSRASVGRIQASAARKGRGDEPEPDLKRARCDADGRRRGQIENEVSAKMPDYQRRLWCMTALDWGFSTGETANQLMQLSSQNARKRLEIRDRDCQQCSRGY